MNGNVTALIVDQFVLICIVFGLPVLTNKNGELGSFEFLFNIKRRNVPEKFCILLLKCLQSTFFKL
jgi:hypothetical protein